MSTVTVSQCFLPIDDADAAIAFYTGPLGYTVVNDVDHEGMRWITIASDAQPGLSVVLESVGAGAPGDREVLAELLAKGVLGRIIFATSDLEATFERLVQAGTEILQEPNDTPWGARDAAFRDPAGNVIRIQQTPSW